MVSMASKLDDRCRLEDLEDSFLEEELCKLATLLNCYENASNVLREKSRLQLENDGLSGGNNTVIDHSLLLAKKKSAQHRHRNHITEEPSWEIVKIWKLFVIIQRYEVRATVLKTMSMSIVHSCPQGLITTNNEEPEALNESPASRCCTYLLNQSESLEGFNERELIRFLFLHCDTFRILLAIIEWCEFVGRIEDHLSVKNCEEKRREIAKLGNLYYSETCYQLDGDLQQQQGSKFYHLDLPTTITNNHVRPSRPPLKQSSYHSGNNKAVGLINPHDNDQCREVYQRLWKFLVNGQIQMIRAMLDQIGEPWIETLLMGKEPCDDPDCLATMFYDSFLIRIPSEVEALIKTECEIESSIMELPLIQSDNESWIHRVLFESTGIILGTKGENNSRHAELYLEGNRWKRLLVKTAERIVNEWPSSLIAYEKAFYGFLCGHSASMLNVCEKYEQVVWVHCIELKEKLIQQIVQQPSNWKLILSEWNICNKTTYKIFEGIFNSSRILCESMTIPQNNNEMSGCLRHIITKYTLARSEPSCLSDIITYLRRLMLNDNDENAAAVENIYPGTLRINNSPEVQLFIREFGAKMKDLCSSLFQLKKEKEYWIDNCDQLLLLYLSASGPSQSIQFGFPLAIDDALFVLSHLSPQHHVEAAVAWLLSLTSILQPDRFESNVEVIKTVVVKYISIFSRIFPHVILRLTTVVWNNFLECKRRPLGANHRALLQLALTILAVAPAFVEWTEETVGGLLTPLTQMFNDMSSQGKDTLTNNIRTDASLTAGQFEQPEEDCRVLEILCRIDYLTFVAILASRLLLILAEDSSASLLRFQSPQMSHDKFAESGLNTSGANDDEDDDEMLYDSSITFYIDLFDSQLTDPLVHLIDELLASRSFVSSNHESVKDILTRFPKTVPPHLQLFSTSSDPKLDTLIQNCSQHLTQNVWDSICILSSSTANYKICLSPLLHYFAIRQFTDVLLCVKDFRVLLSETLIKVAARRQPDLHELSILSRRLASSFETFPWSPFMMQVPLSKDGDHARQNNSYDHFSQDLSSFCNPTGQRLALLLLDSLSSSTMNCETICKKETECFDRLMIYIIYLLKEFVQCVNTFIIPKKTFRMQGTISPYIKESMMIFIESLHEMIRNNDELNVIPLQAKTDVESILADVELLFKTD